MSQKKMFIKQIKEINSIIFSIIIVILLLIISLIIFLIEGHYFI